MQISCHCFWRTAGTSRGGRALEIHDLLPGHAGPTRPTNATNRLSLLLVAICFANQLDQARAVVAHVLRDEYLKDKASSLSGSHTCNKGSERNDEFSQLWRKSQKSRFPVPPNRRRVDVYPTCRRHVQNIALFSQFLIRPLFHLRISPNLIVFSTPI